MSNLRLPPSADDYLLYGEMRALEEMEAEREVCEGSLIEFLRRAWTHLGESGEFIVNWHHWVIADDLEAVARGEIRDLVINQPPRPVADDQMVLCRDRGLIPLKEIVVGDSVLTHRRRWRRVDAVHLQGELECLRITTRKGRELDLAPDHPVLTPDGWQPAWMLRADDVIGVVPGRSCGTENTITEDEARLLGYLIGDGHCSGTPNVTAASDAVARDVAACALALGFVPKVQKYGFKTRRISLIKGDLGYNTGTHTSIALTASQAGKGRAGRPRGAKGYLGPVRAWMSAHGVDGKNSYTKRVPLSVMRASDGIVAEFIGAYWSCDGHISTKGAKRDGTERDDLVIACNSVSKDLMHDIQLLLTRLGISTILRRKTAKITTKRQGGDIYVSYQLEISDQDNVARFARTIHLEHEKDARIRKARRRRFDFDHDIWGEVVASVESVGSKPCRCLTVADDKSFLANGIAVHNTTKTLLCNAVFPAWLWCQPPERQMRLMGPHVRILSVSYGATLAEEIAVKMRRLVLGEWYQRLWGERVKLQPDQASRSNFANTAGGERISASIEGGILGRGADLIICDDIHNIKGAESDVQRRETLDGMRALSTRVTDPRISARVMISQRLHVDDGTNYALENWRRGLVHRWFPMRFDETRVCPVDQRVAEGQLLWPEVWNDEAVSQEEQELGPYMASSQLQQAPIPRGGGIIKRPWWRLWPDDAERDAGYRAQYKCGERGGCGWSGERLQLESVIDCPVCGMQAERRIVFPPTSFRLLSVDTGIGDKEINSYSAATLWGIWHGKDDAPRVMLMDAWRGRPMLRGGSTGERGLVEIIAALANRRLVDTVLIERKTRGVDLYNELARMLRDYPWSLEFFEPTGRGDKSARLSSVQPLFTNDLVWAPNKTWADMVINEVCNAPYDKHNDLSDTCSAGLLHLRDTNRLSMSQEHAAEVRRSMVFKGRSMRFNASETFEGA